ncbi:MAG: hypothetical protein KJO49_13140 [Bacteroidia bacterium]|nr:hypothetical protein [Bacteroidia bacterium]
MKKIETVVFLVTILLGCSPDNNDEFADQIIFGRIAGQCVGDCRELFLLTEQGLYSDSNTDTDFGDLIDVADWENTTFESNSLSNEKFELAQHLLQIPEILFESDDEFTEQIWADIDYFIQIKSNGNSKSFIFDKIAETADLEIIQYMEDMIDVYDLLSE